MSLAVVGLALAAALQAGPSWQYEIALDAQETLRVRVCAPTGTAVRLQALDDAALSALVEPGADGWTLDRQQRQLERADRAGCAAYRVALGTLADRRQQGYGYRVGGDLLTWTDAWLWWPHQHRGPIRASVDLPPGWQFSTPWPQPDLDQNDYELGGWPRQWPGLVAFGPFDQRLLGSPDARLKVAILGDLELPKRDQLANWVDHLGDLLAPVGGLPLPQTQVLVVPTARSGGPVPWGQVYRAGYGGVHFFVNAEQSPEAFLADWTGAHEFSHLLHPYLGTRGRWMAEGLASYYQNVLRGRSGLLSEKDVWEKLLAGFERGRRDRSAGQSLASVTQHMRRERAFMRVYWSGAAWWLRRDVELRQQSDGKLSLDRLLARFAARHLPAQRRWTPEQFAAALDELAGMELFEVAVATAERETSFPDMRDLHERLGLVTDASGQLSTLNQHAELAAVRRQIAGPASRVLADGSKQSPTTD